VELKRTPRRAGRSPRRGIEDCGRASKPPLGDRNRFRCAINVVENRKGSTPTPFCWPSTSPNNWKSVWLFAGDAPLTSPTAQRAACSRPGKIQVAAVRLNGRRDRRHRDGTREVGCLAHLARRQLITPPRLGHHHLRGAWDQGLGVQRGGASGQEGELPPLDAPRRRANRVPKKFEDLQPKSDQEA